MAENLPMLLYHLFDACSMLLRRLFEHSISYAIITVHHCGVHKYGSGLPGAAGLFEDQQKFIG
jgi:hypothetical protein